jgi:hypothetical protein
MDVASIGTHFEKTVLEADGPVSEMIRGSGGSHSWPEEQRDPKTRDHKGASSSTGRKNWTEGLEAGRNVVSERGYNYVA